MWRSWRTYTSVVRSRLKSLAHFRVNLVAWILYSPLQLGVIYLLWGVVYQKTDAVGSFTFGDMMLYYLVVHFLRRIIEPVQTINYEVWNEINKGRLDIYLARPIHFGPFMFFRSLGPPILEILIGAPFFLLFSLAIGLPIQSDPFVLLAFAASVAAGYVILFFIQFLIGSLTFWMERIFGIRDMIFSVFMLFSGQLIPISVLPDWVVEISSYLPFESIYYIPATLYTQSQVGPEAAGFLLRQIVWIALLWTLAAAVWTRGVTRYASQGG